MKIYIQSAEAISAQDTFRSKSADTPRSGSPDCLLKMDFHPLSGDQLNKCIHPDYKQYIDPRALRRMSPVIRMGLAAAKVCLVEAGIEKPDAILVGSGLGCIGDTVKFLSQLIDKQETLPNPTAFIQSTHNTVSGQIALMLECRAYNLTFSQNAISFESALLEAAMLLNEKHYTHILLGGIDEGVEESFQLMKENGCVTEPMGEGSTFFVLSSEQNEKSMARVDGPKILNKCKAEEMAGQTREFLASMGLLVEEIDLIISGRSRDGKSDSICDQVEGVFPEDKRAGFKHLAGSYDTASAFGMWLGARIIRENFVPDAARTAPGVRGSSSQIRHVLLFNQSKGRDYSWILLSHPES